MIATLAIYLHRIDPFVLEFPAGWFMSGIRWYGLSYLLGFGLGYLILTRLVKRGLTSIKPAEMGDLVIYVALALVIGGRVGYCLFYKPQLLGWIDHFPYWGVLAINEGGMASHGALAGGAVGCWIYARRRGHAFLHVMDVAVFSGTLGIAFGRIANFINGELYGRAVAAGSLAMRWAVQFPQELPHWSIDQLRKLGPAVETLGGSAGAWQRTLDHLQTAAAAQGLGPSQWQELAGREPQGLGAGLVQDVERVAYTLIARTQESGPSANAAAAALRSVLTPRHPSQLYSAVLEGLVVFLAMAYVWRKPRKPMVISCVFGMVYAIVRISDEFFRMPDAHLLKQEFALWGITRGQLLSLVLFLAAVGFMFWARRRKVEPMGGWAVSTQG